MLCAIALAAWFFCRPVIVLHYSADAQKPVAYFLNENDQITRGELAPGQTEKFYTPMFASRDAWIEWFPCPLLMLKTASCTVAGVEPLTAMSVGCACPSRR